MRFAAVSGIEDTVPHWTFRSAVAPRLLRASGPFIAGAVLLALGGHALAASTFNPTAIVNTESFEVIDEGDSNSNVELRFGQNINQKLLFDKTNTRFKMTQGLFIAGSLTTTGAAIINVGNTTATPDTGIALEILGTASGRSLHAQDTLSSSGFLVIVGNARIDGNTFFLDAAANKVGIGTITPKSQLEVQGAMSGNSLYVSRAFSGAGLVDCSTANTSKLLWSSATKQFSCGTDQTGAGGGLTQPDADLRYVSVAGDTMTGGLLIVATAHSPASAKAGLLLEIGGTMSGSDVFAQKSLRSSGTLVVTGNVKIDGTTFFADTVANRVGIGLILPKTQLEVQGAMSGNSLYVSRAFSGAGLVDCSTAVTSKLLWSQTTKQFSCGTDQTGGGGGSTFGSGNVVTIGDLRYVNVSGDTMTGGLLIQSSTLHGVLPVPDAGTLLEVQGAMSGRTLAIGPTAAASTGVLVRAQLAPLADLVNISTNGYLVTNPNTNALSILFAGGATTGTFETSAVRLDLTPGTISAGTATWNGYRVVTNGTGPTASVTENGLKVEGPTSGGAGTYNGILITGGSTALGGTMKGLAIAGITAGAGTEVGLVVGAGWDLAANFAGTASGRLIHAQNKLESSGTLIVRGLTTYPAFYVDSVNGKVGIGGTAGLALLTLSGSTTARSALRIGSGATPLAANQRDGDIWNDVSRKAIGMNMANAKQMLPGVLFTQTGSVAWTTTTGTGYVLGNGIGTQILPANFFMPGKTVRITAQGVLTTSATPGTLKFSVKMGTTTWGTFTATPVVSLANRTFTVSFLITCRSIGASGVCFGNGYTQIATSDVLSAFWEFNSSNTSRTVNTTAAQRLDVLVTTSSNVNTITGLVGMIEVLN
jgi:hypothetical protein